MRTLALLLVLATTTTAAAADVREAVHRVTLEDPAGDVQADGDEPVLDLTGLTITSDGSKLDFSLTLATGAADVLAATNSAGSVVTVFIDLDDDPATGVTTMFAKKPGFEREIEIKACIEYDQGQACGGGLREARQKGFFSAWGVRRAEGGELERTHDVFWESPRGVVEGKTLSVSVPYAELGIQPGRTVRIAVQETGGGFGPEGFLPEVRLKLK
ncbi:MAG: hypothetical protein F9K18_00610 [Thermoanaerobaculia bacterium]|nr:MAG: hypothetical protein F9K18_00610 [Thermoanaerobaculia bacterium]